MKKRNSKLIRLFVGLFAGLILLVSAYLVGMNRMMSHINSEVPPNLDFSTSRISENNLFQVSYTSSEATVPVNQIHQWTLHVEAADGGPVENASITIDGDMPEHGHGLPTRPRVTRYLGNGDYLVEGMKFQMGGWWVMDFTIKAEDKSDTVHFNMMLK